MLGVLAGWGMYRWLLPKPLWTKDQSAFDTAFWPLTEDQEGKYLVVRETSVRPGPVLKQTGLMVLDQRTGKTLYETPADFGETDDECDAPRILGDSSWRIKGTVGHELRRWRFKTDLPEEVIHTWAGSSGVYHHFDWSQDRHRLLVQTQFHYQRYLLALQSDFILRAWFATLYNSTLPSFTWCECWELPIDENSKAKCHARWSPHCSRWGDFGNLSADGKYMVYGDSFFYGSYRSRIGLQQTLQGEALLDVFRQQPAGCLIYDTSTGKLHQHVTMPNYFFDRPFWFKNTLFSKGFATDGRLARSEELLHPTTTGFVFYQWTTDKNVAFHIDQQNVTPISLPAELTDGHLYATVVNHALALEKLEMDSSDVHVLKGHANSLQVELELRQIPHLDSFGRSWMLPGCNQIISDTSSPPDPLDSVRAWVSKIPWLADWASTRQMGVHFAFLHSPTTARPYGIALGQVCCNYNKPDLHHLYLMSWSFEEDGFDCPKVLSCYAMPMQFYSTWWSIGAGLVVMVFGLVVLTRRVVRRSRMV